ncbi:MAG: hypothetical protein F6K39_42530 [Okeania sp. SIO3B3]|nr:hypothetical protein [Okeania sp. SIO3B3]
MPSSENICTYQERQKAGGRRQKGILTPALCSRCLCSSIIISLTQQAIIP